MKSKQFLVLGLGRFGASLAKTLCDLGQEVLAVDADEELVNNIAPYVTQAMQLDATDETLLASLGVKNFDAAIVSIGQNTRDSILVCVLLKELGAPYLVAKANDDLHAKVLRKIGADRVIFPERDMGKRVAHNLMAGNILDFIELSPDYSMVEIQVPQEWNGKTLAQLDLRKRLGINVIAIRRDGHVDPSPMPGTLLSSSDRMLVMAGHDIIKKLGQA